jgi:predicted oxidoreductase
MIAGCMNLGGGWTKGVTVGEAHAAQAEAFIAGALDSGVNFFDHADVYAWGNAEEAFGRGLARHPGLRPSVVIQTKCGIRWKDEPAGAPHRYDFSRAHIVEAAEGSLRRLKTDYLDILLLHRPDPLWEGEEIAAAFAELKAAGKVRHFGVSNMNAGQMAYLQHYLNEPLVADQLQMSLLHHGFVEAGISFNQVSEGYPQGWEGALEYCRLNGVALQAWSPLDKGLLASAPLSALTPTQRSAAELVRAMAASKGVPPEAIALAWLLRHPAGIMPVIGTTNPGRFAACAAAASVFLSREEWYALLEAARGRPVP